MKGGATGPMKGAAEGEGCPGRTTGAPGDADARVADGEGDGGGDVCLLCGGRGRDAAVGEAAGLCDAVVAVGEAEGLGRRGCLAGAGDWVGAAVGVRVGVAPGDGFALAHGGSGEGRLVSGAAVAVAVSTARVAEAISRSSTSNRLRAAVSRARLIPLRSTPALSAALQLSRPERYVGLRPDFL
ncbi:MAG: hypothetical protein QOE05_3053 [Actinomycetota bacterium]|jgi:hypothetical protein|nr:hypothetical protein [Actinomycetota bacterium]